MWGRLQPAAGSSPPGLVYGLVPAEVGGLKARRRLKPAPHRLTEPAYRSLRNLDLRPRLRPDLGEPFNHIPCQRQERLRPRIVVRPRRHRIPRVAPDPHLGIERNLTQEMDPHAGGGLL